MTYLVGIIVGISGVGKTRLLEKVSAVLPVKVLSASTLIRESIAEAEGQLTPQDHLRARSIYDNQVSLLEAFKRNVKPSDNLVILDAHVVIDTPDGLVRIGTDVFRAINPDFVVFVKGEPRRILRNRQRDASRMRPERSISSLTRQQEFAIVVAREVATELSIPIHFVMSGDDVALTRILSAPLEAEPNV